MLKHRIHPIPRDLLKYEYNFIQQDGTLVNLGTKWSNAWKKFSTDFFKKGKPGVLLSRNGKAYRFSGPRNNWNIYYKGVEGVARFLQKNKLNTEPGFDEKESGLMLETTHKENMNKKSEFVDNIKFTGSAEPFRHTQPFWIHYMWTHGANAGSQGQLKYFKASNLKYAFDTFKETA